MAEVNSVLNNIHYVVQKSGLHFIINQTPWSSYITIRKKFTNPEAYDDISKDIKTVETETLKARNKQTEEKLQQVEMESNKVEEELKVVRKNYEKTVAHLKSKINILESDLEKAVCQMKNKMTEILVLEKEKKVKDEIIQNLNAGFQKKVADLNSKVKGLESFKRETHKSEKRATKKLRQKAEKEAAKTKIGSAIEFFKDPNHNFPDTNAHAHLVREGFKN